MPAGRHLPLRRDQHHLVTLVRAERVRELRPEHDAELSGLEIIEAARLHMQADVGYLVFEAGQYAADQRALDTAIGREHPLPQHVRRRRLHPRMLSRFVGDLLPARELVPAPVIWTCEATPRMRARSSF